MSFGSMTVEEIPLGNDPQMNDLLVTCFPFKMYQIIKLLHLMSRHGGCNFIYETASIKYHVAAAKWCNAKGYKAGIVLTSSMG